VTAASKQRSIVLLLVFGLVFFPSECSYSGNDVLALSTIINANGSSGAWINLISCVF
jgi:hypothetical protein